MSATRRRGIADTMDELDRQIWDLQASKKDAYTSYREALKKDGMRDADIKTEVDALKKAIARRRSLIEKPGVVEEFDAKVDEITADIMAKRPVGTVRATHVARGAREAAPTPHDPETGEVDAPAPATVRLTNTEMPADMRDEILRGVAQVRADYGDAAATPPPQRPYRVTDPAPAPAAPAEEAELPAFLDRRTWIDGKPAEASAG